MQLKIAGATYDEIASILGNIQDIVRQTYAHAEAGGKVKILSLLDKRQEARKRHLGSELAMEGD